MSCASAASSSWASSWPSRELSGLVRIQRREDRRGVRRAGEVARTVDGEAAVELRHAGQHVLVQVDELGFAMRVVSQQRVHLRSLSRLNLAQHPQQKSRSGWCRTRKSSTVAKAMRVTPL